MIVDIKMEWLCLLFVLMPIGSVYSESLNSTSPCTDINHIFLAPGVLTAGGNDRACVSRFHSFGAARLSLELLAGAHTASAARDLPPGDGGCIDIAVPQTPNTNAKLVARVWYPDSKCTWEKTLSVLVSDGRVLVVQTERARYRPGDTLRARVLALKPDLAPAHAQIDEVWLEGPRGAWDGARAAQWQRVRTRMGIAQVQHELDELAPAGRWTIRAKLADGSQGSAAFWVGNYDLPPFQLNVRHAPRVLRTSERLVWTVCVRYPWSEAVEGLLVIRIRGAGGSSPRAPPAPAAPGISTVVRLRAPRACHRHAAAARRVPLAGADPPDVVVADFSFQEDGTRTWQNTTVVSHIVDQAVTLEFLRKQQAVIAPGLPYKLKVKATRWDDKPATNELIHVCRTSDTLNDTCRDASTDDRGIARVTFAAVDDGSRFYTFQASLQNDSTISAPPLVVPAGAAGAAGAALGPVRPDPASAKTTVPLYITLRNVTKPLTVHFVVITRGGIIYRWGATTQCPQTSSSDYIPTASRNTQCNYNRDANTPSNLIRPKTTENQANLITKQSNKEAEQINETNKKTNGSEQKNVINDPIDTENADIEYTDDDDILAENLEINPGYYQTNANEKIHAANIQEDATNETISARNEDIDPDSLMDRHLLRVMLPIKVTHQMCPDSHLVAYFYYNGELVSASKQIEMEECFSNKVEATWLSRQVSPGSLASIRVATPGPALCALSVLDAASKWTLPAPSVKELVMAALRRLMDSHRNLTEYAAAGACFKTSDMDEVPTSSQEETASWLAAAGVRVAGGNITESRKCFAPPAPLIDDATVPRSDFSEAWLWRLVPVGANGSSTVSARAPDSISRFEASAVCVARAGLAQASPAVLQVFREFFIHADGPRRLRRGDATVVRYRIFNYLYEPLSVQVQIVADSHLELTSSTPETICVGARASEARRVELRARAPGRARLAVRARAVPDPSCGKGRQAHVSDEVIIPIAVEPEGVPVQEHKSILLCGKGSPESSQSEVSWAWAPALPVAGTEALSVWAAGDIKGPLLFDADGLVTLPRGCGEQNMARLAANLLALTQLPPDSAAAATAKEHVSRGFTRQLGYTHPLGGFSAFGAADAAPSTWLTAFSLKYLRRAHQILSPGLAPPPALARAERWLLDQQMENGCFRNEGQVFHRELRGGLNEEGEIASVALTAFVITALVDGAGPLPSRVLRNSLACLRALPPPKTRSPARVYAQALLGYAFMRLRSYEEDLRKTNEASLLWDKKEPIGAGLKEDEELRELMALLKGATRSGDLMWWETSSLSTSIEATSYALLALSYCAARLQGACAGDARAAVRWLSAHRNHAGGFQSTQDTLVALEALSSWSTTQPSAPTNLIVRLKSGEDVKKITILPDTKIPEVTRITDKSQVDVSVEGTGCALVQATRSYNTLVPDQPEDKKLTVQATVRTDGVFDCDLNRTSCFCAAVVEVCVSWTGEFPTMALVEATLPSGFAVDASRVYAQLQEPDTLVRRIEVTPSGGRVTLYLSALAGTEDAGAGHSCTPLAAVGPRARTRPAHVRVADYYAPHRNHTQMYTIPEDCPPRIAHSTNDYHSSDNLFSKAKSLSDSGEILITHEFSFEDIPEGIPLDDPLYDFGRDDIAYLTEYNEVKSNKDEEKRETAEDLNANIVDNLNKSTYAHIRTDSNTKLKQKSNPQATIRASNEEKKRNNNTHKNKARNYRKGHSLPFARNYYEPNYRINDFNNIFYNPVIGPSHSYPEHLLYEINPYARKIEQNPAGRYYQENKARLYDGFDPSHYREDFRRPFIPENKNTYAKSSLKNTGHNNRTRWENKERNVYSNIEHNSPSNYYEGSTLAPIIVQNENFAHRDFVSEIPSFSTEHSVFASSPTSRPFGFENFQETNRRQYQPNPHTPPQSNTPAIFVPELNAPTAHPNIPFKSEVETIPSNHKEYVETPPFKYPETEGGHNANLQNHNSATTERVPTVSAITNLNLEINSTKYNPGVHTVSSVYTLDGDSERINQQSSTHSSIFHSDIAYVNPPSNFNPSHLPYSNEQIKEPTTFGAQTDNPSLSNHYTSPIPNFPYSNPILSSSISTPSNFNNIHPDLSTSDPKPFTLSPLPSNARLPISSNQPSIQSQKVASQLDNPNLSGFHVIESEADLEVPAGLEGPVPAVALPPQNFVAVAPPPGFQPPFPHGGYPRLYPFPRPHYPYYRHVPAG